MRINRDVKKRTEGLLLIICLLFTFLTGCGTNTDVQTTTVSLHKDGSITQTIVEDFPTEQYDIEELKQMNEEDVALYNETAGKEAVNIKRTAADGKKVTIVMDYQNANDYFGLNGTVLYFGTVEQAKTAGYSMDVILKSIKDDETIGKEELQELSKRHIAIVTENMNVATFGTILYVSEGVSVSKNKKLATITGDENAYIVFK